jgi:4-hydroxy-2-oxoheptanedioate aldolase
VGGETDEHFPLLRKRLEDRIAEGHLAICLRATLASVNEIAFIAHATGFDALYVDLEHSTASLDDAAHICSTATALGITPLVRLGSAGDEAAVKLLDAGCQGVIAPQVETADQAQRLVDRCLFPPRRHRSATGPALQLGYQSLAPQEQAARLNDATLVCVMLESERAMAAAGEIAAAQGIDLLLVGTQDLTCALGMPGLVDDPAVVAAYQQVAKAAAATATAFGVAGVSGPQVLSRYVGLGARFLTAGSDIELLRGAARERVEQLRRTAP